MAYLVLSSTGGAPGVTTLAVGLALTWPRPVLLADCDPGAHQAILAGYLRGQSARGKGLIRVAEAHRDRRQLRDVVMDQTIPLTNESTHPRRFLPGFAKPGSANLFRGAWADLADTFDRFGDDGMDVIIDAGRVGPEGLPAPLVERAAIIGIVTRSSLRAIMSASIHATTFHDQAHLLTTDHALGLFLIGEGHPYGRKEVSRALGMPVLASIADDTGAAGYLSDSTSRPRRFDASPLAKSLHNAAHQLAERLQRTAEQVRS